MEKILVSACLVGAKVRYDGKDNYCSHPIFRQWLCEGRLIPICPEVAGGGSITRPPVEISGADSGTGVLNNTARTLTRDGQDFSDLFVSGARTARGIAKKNNIKMAVLKSNSPSCGNKTVYDGSFSKTLINGSGVTAALLIKEGIRVFNETEIPEAENHLKKIEEL